MSASDAGEAAGAAVGGAPDEPTPRRREGGPLHDAERARDAAEASRDRFAFLAEVSRCLADSLDYETTLATVAGMSLPYLGAWCIVDVLTEEGDIRRLAVLHPDPTKQALARVLHERYPPRPGDLIGVPRVIRSGRPELVFDVPDAALAAAAHDAAHLDLLRALGTRAYVIVPMVARGRTLGAITFVTADDTRRFGDLDVVIAEDLARRAAMAVDNARLHREAQAAREQAEVAAEEAEAASEEAELDSDEARRARDEAEAALATRSQFVSMMSHEFRTPVNAIIGYAQLLELGVAGPVTEQQRDYLARLAATSEHLRGLVDDVLDVARVDAGGVQVAHALGMTGELIAVALDLVRPQASAKGVRLIDLRPGDAGEPFVGDEHRVRQVLANLLANAVKFTPRGGTVTVGCGRRDEPPPAATLRGPGPWTFIQVADTGIGIPPGDQARVFEPFFQVQNSHARRADGTGLGLAISRRFARLMGGDLTFESTSGAGSTFTLWLPAGVPGGAGAESGDRADSHERARGTAAATRVYGLAEVGVHLRARLEDVLAAVATRLRTDPDTPGAARLARSELEDHVLTFLADVAQSLVVVEETGGPESDVLRDGTTIQRVVSELHGAMRQRRGWSEAEIGREYEILGEELAAAVAGRVPEGAGDASLARDVLARLVDRARAVALASARRTAEAGEPGGG